MLYRMVRRDEEAEAALPVSAVLQLLDEATAESGAPSGLPAISAAHVPAAEAAALEERLRNLRSVLSRLRRRGQELSALFSTAGELAELRDTDALLHRLVERAHELMGTDVTYLSEFHEGSDDLRVRSTLGAIAPSFRELRVPPGMGLASKVVRTRCPQWTSLYQQNHAIPHESGIDAAVDAEGLVSILGVPLVAGERVLGVLFAANRSEHTFTPDEIALLSAFANHAAVVLQTTSLLERARIAAEDAERANAVLANNMTAMERASAVHEDLTAVVLKGGSAEGVAGTLSTALGRSVTILDRDLAPVAHTPPAIDMGLTGSGAELHPAVRRAIDEGRSSGRCVFVEGRPPLPDVAVAVVAGEAFLGAVLVGHGDLELGAVEQRTIERAAQIAALVAVQQDAVAEAEERVRGELVTDILRGDASRRQELALRARARDVRLEELRSVVAVVVPAEARRAASAALRKAVPGGLVGELDGVLAALTPSPDPLEAAHELWSTLQRAEHPALVVAAPPAKNAEGLGERFEAARRCAQLLTGWDVDDGAVDAQAYAPYLAMFGAGTGDLSGFIDAVIGPVLRWDDERGTDLFTTLRTFADTYASPTRTARALHLHINTVTQRLDRITALLGAEWREPEPLFRISVAARLHALRRRHAPG